MLAPMSLVYAIMLMSSVLYKVVSVNGMYVWVCCRMLVLSPIDRN